MERIRFACAFQPESHPDIARLLAEFDAALSGNSGLASAASASDDIRGRSRRPLS